MNKLGLVVLVSITACGGSSDLTSNSDTRGASGSPEEVARPAPRPAPKPAPSKPAPPALAFGPSEPGPAYIVVADGIVALLPDGTAKLVAGMSKSPGQLTLGLDGVVYATDREPKLGVYKLDGATATKLGSVPARLSTAFVVGKDGIAYVAQYEDVFRFDGKRATKLERPGKPENVTELGFDPEGKLVAAGWGGASVLAGEAWKRLEIPQLDATDQVWLAGDGNRLVVASRHGLLELADDKLTPSYGKATARRRPAMTNGIIGLYDYGKRHPITRLYDRSGATVSSERFSGSTGTVFDARGRLWYVSGGTLVVESLLGSERTAYPPGTLAGLVKIGDDTSLDQLVVVGGGPEVLPPIGTAQVVEVVTGKIVIGSTPLANAKVEICSYASFSYTSSPCGGGGSQRTATTNASGEFSFANVPLGTYALAFHTGRKWAISDSKISLPAAAPAKAVGTLRYQ